MNRLPSFPSLALLLGVGLAALPACGDSSGPESLTVDALQGHWKATSLLYRDLADSSLSLEMVATGQQTIDLSFQVDLYARVDTFPTPRFALAYDSGTVAVTAPRLTLTSNGGDTFTMGATLANGRLTLTDTVSMRLLCPTGCAAPTLVRYRFQRVGG